MFDIGLTSTAPHFEKSGSGARAGAARAGRRRDMTPFTCCVDVVLTDAAAGTRCPATSRDVDAELAREAADRRRRRHAGAAGRRGPAGSARRRRRGRRRRAVAISTTARGAWRGGSPAPPVLPRRARGSARLRSAPSLAAPVGLGSRRAALRRCSSRASLAPAPSRSAALVDRQHDLPDLHLVAGLDLDARRPSRRRRRHFDGGLVGLELDDRLILRDHVAGVHEHADDIALLDVLSELGQLEFQSAI